jgi:hypothetical protein
MIGSVVKTLEGSQACIGKGVNHTLKHWLDSHISYDSSVVIHSG